MQFPFTGQMWFALRQWLPTCSVVPLTSKSQQEATGGEVRSSVELETEMEAFFNREHSQAANRLFSFTSHNTSDRQLAASALPGWGTVNFRHFSRVLIACSSLLSGVKWKAYCLKQQQPFSLWISVKMKHELFQSILVLPLAHCPRNPSSGLQITVSNLCPSLIKITWAHSVFRNWMMRFGLSNTVAHLCGLGGRGLRWTRMTEGAIVERQACLFPGERRWQEGAIKTCNAFSVFSWMPCQLITLPNVAAVSVFPLGLLGWQSILFSGWLVVVASDLVSSVPQKPLWTVICSGRWGPRWWFFFSFHNGLSVSCMTSDYFNYWV